MLSVIAKRRKSRKNESRKLRREGLLPAVVYGYDFDNINISIEKFFFMSVLRSIRRNDTFDLKIEKDGPVKVIVKNFQKDPKTSEITHVDFYKLTPDRMVDIEVPVVLKGECKGVKLGGNLYQVRKKVNLLALPSYIPNEIVADVTDLNIGDVVHLFDLSIPENTKIHSSKNFTIVAVLGKTKEETEKSEEELQEEVKE